MAIAPSPLADEMTETESSGREVETDKRRKPIATLLIPKKVESLDAFSTTRLEDFAKKKRDTRRIAPSTRTIANH